MAKDLLNDINTKSKILAIAKHLFAVKGYNGTSIRDISESAKVNVAAIHYHFQSKENLYHQVIRTSYVEVSEKVKALKSKYKKLSKFLIAVFRLYLKNSDEYLTTMKLILSKDHSHDEIVSGTEDELIGPPGGQSLYEVIQAEVKNNKCTDSDYHWAVKSIYSYLVQMTMVYTCCYKTSKKKSTKFISQVDIENGLVRLSDIVVLELKRNKLP